jgi:hypothetical protein
VALPAAVDYGQVKWRAVSAIADGIDADGEPDATAVTGTVKFAPSATVLLAVDEADPITVFGTTVTYSLDSDGVLRDSQGRDLITLVATDSAGLSPQGWTWRATYTLDGGASRGSFSFALPAGTVVDLTTVAPVSASNGVAIIQGPQGPPGPAGPSSSNVGTIDAADYGLTTGGTATANTTALAAAFDAAIAADLECYIGAGTYNLNPGLHWNSDIVRLRGAGSQSTILRFAATGTDGLRVGTGAYVTDLGSQGWVRDLRITSAAGPPATSDGHAALLVDSIKFGHITNLYVGGFDVGIDMTNNNYGTSFQNVHSRYGESNLALRLRPSTESGNDFQFLNCWLAGLLVAVSVESDATSGADGFHFIGGQLSAGRDLTADRDDLGVITINRDWLAGTTTPGEASRVTLTGTTFEGWHRLWAVRIYQPIRDLVFRDVAVTSKNTAGQAAAPLGFLKHSNPFHDNITFDGLVFQGEYKTALLSLTPATGSANPTYIERGTSGRPTVNSVQQDLFARGMFDRAGLTRGIALSGGTKSILMLDGLRLRNNSGVLETSTNGTTFVAIVEPTLPPNQLSANESRAATDVTVVSPVNGTVARSTTVYRDSVAPTSYALTYTGTSAPRIAPSTANFHAVTAGQTVQLSAWLLTSNAARQGKISLWWYDSANALVTAVDGTYTALSTTVWTKVTNSGVCPAGATKFAWVVNGNAGTAADILYATEVYAATT